MKATADPFRVTYNLYAAIVNPPRSEGWLNANVIVVAVGVGVPDISGGLNVAVACEIVNAGDVKETEL